MPTITLQQLQYFLSAVEHGSLSAAAEAHYIAQPSLSEQIRRLEQQLGVTLFTRTNRRLILSDAARAFLPYAQRAVAAADEAVASVDPVRTLTGGSVLFGTFSSAQHLLHVGLVARFRSLHPRVRVRLVSLNSVEIAEAVREGRLEAGLVALPVDDRGLDVGPVEWVAEAVYLTTEAVRARRPVTIETLAEASLVLPEVGRGDTDPTRRQLLALAQQAGVKLEPVVEVDSPATALKLAERGVGDTVISLSLAKVLGSTRRLHWAPLDPPLLESFAFVTRRAATLSPATAELVRVARACLAELPRAPHSPS